MKIFKMLFSIALSILILVVRFSTFCFCKPINLNDENIWLPLSKLPNPIIDYFAHQYTNEHEIDIYTLSEYELPDGIKVDLNNDSEYEWIIREPYLSGNANYEMKIIRLRDNRVELLFDNEGHTMTKILDDKVNGYRILLSSYRYLDNYLLNYTLPVSWDGFVYNFAKPEIEYFYVKSNQPISVYDNTSGNKNAIVAKIDPYSCVAITHYEQIDKKWGLLFYPLPGFVKTNSLVESKHCKISYDFVQYLFYSIYKEDGTGPFLETLIPLKGDNLQYQHCNKLSQTLDYDSWKVAILNDFWKAYHREGNYITDLSNLFDGYNQIRSNYVNESRSMTTMLKLIRPAITQDYSYPKIVFSINHDDSDNMLEDVSWVITNDNNEFKVVRSVKSCYYNNNIQNNIQEKREQYKQDKYNQVISVLSAYFYYISVQDYNSAYDILSKNMKRKIPFSQFIKGYLNVGIHEISRINTISDKDNKYTVVFTLMVEEGDKIQVYDATYTLGHDDDDFYNMKILSAKVVKVK